MSDIPTNARQGRVTARSLLLCVFVGAGLYAIIRAFPLFSPILISFVFVLLIALALNPLVDLFCRFCKWRTLAACLVMVSILTVVGIAGWALCVPLKSSTLQFVQKFPEYWKEVQRPLVKIEHKAAITEQRLQQEVAREVAKETGGAKPPSPQGDGAENGRPSSLRGFLRGSLSQLLDAASRGVQDFAINVGALLIVMITVLFGAVFMLANPQPIVSGMFSIVPERHHAKAERIVQRVAVFVPRWALGTILAMLAVGTLVFLLTWPLFGATDAWMLGLIAMLLEVIPYLGPALSALPALLFGLGVGGWTPLWVVLIYATVQIIENTVISPLIMAGQLRLHPLLVLFAMLVSAAIFGVLGVLIAAPAAALLRILHEELYLPRFLPNTTEQDLKRMSRRVLTHSLTRE